MKIYNSLSNKIEEFKPIHKNQINMYVCGPTVYNYIHIGNARPIVFFDLVKRYFTYLGYQVYYVTNITDIDDSIINKALMQNESEKEIAQKYEEHFLEDLIKLGSQMPDLLPHATDFIPAMVTYIQQLIDKDFAYVTDSGVYFRISKIQDYGLLSNQQKDNLYKSVRVQVESDKENEADFAVWKFTHEGITFDAPFGKGRPGWHTECTVMNYEIFNKEIDIHGGGMDLKFPHHENEIAQASAISHHHIAKYWMHVGRLDLENVKMSKSLGNVVLVKDLLEDFSPYAYRLLLFAHHYRAPLQYSTTLMEQYQKIYERISYTINRSLFMFDLENIKKDELDEEFMNQFKSYMDNDFNTSNVISLIDDGIKRLNKENDIKLTNSILKVLDILGIKLKLNRATAHDFQVYQDWIDARNEKNFQKADELRKHLLDHGWI